MLRRAEQVSVEAGGAQRPKCGEKRTAAAVGGGGAVAAAKPWQRSGAQTLAAIRAQQLLVLVAQA